MKTSVRIIPLHSPQPSTVLNQIDLDFVRIMIPIGNRKVTHFVFSFTAVCSVPNVINASVSFGTLHCTVFLDYCVKKRMIVKLISKRIVMVVNCSVNKGMPRLFEFIVRRLLFVFKPVWMKILSILRRTMYQLVTFMAFFSIFQKINRYW